MTQIVFLLFENSRVPKDSKDRYRVEIHFSPGAKGREEIIASGGRASSLKLAQKRHSVPLRRMLPNNINYRKASHLEGSTFNHNPVKLNQPAKLLPSLISQEQLTIRQAASKNSLFEKLIGDSASPKSSFPNSRDITTITEEMCKFCISLINMSISEYGFIFIVNTDLATTVKPLKRLCTISLSEMEEFLSNDELLKDHHSSIGSHRSSIGSQRSSTGSIL